jgi:hypothetical protein
MGTTQTDRAMATPGVVFGSAEIAPVCEMCFVPDRMKRQSGRIGCRIEVDNAINEVVIAMVSGYASLPPLAVEACLRRDRVRQVLAQGCWCSLRGSRQPSAAKVSELDHHPFLEILQAWAG